MQALIVDTEVVELRPDDEVYTVVSGWYWVPVPEKLVEEINSIDWIYDRESDTFSLKPEYIPTWDESRRGNYPTFADQFSDLYDDIAAGVFGEAAKTGKFYTSLKEVKDSFPKPE